MDSETLKGSSDKNHSDAAINIESNCSNQKRINDSIELLSNKKLRSSDIVKNALKFQVNQNAILDFADDCLNPDLKSLGITSFNQDTYEQEVIHQLEKAIENTDNTLDNEKKDESSISDDNEIEDADHPSDEDYVADEEETESKEKQDDEDLSIEPYLDDDVDQFEEAAYSQYGPRKKKWSQLEIGIDKSREKIGRLIVDDGKMTVFKKRIAKYRLYQAENNILDSDEQYYNIDDQLRIPQRIWDRLFEHQRECVRWLWGLHRNLCGGIMGDEMGLGKTIQVIAFLVALSCTNYREVGHIYPSLGPVLLVTPATVMHQWVSELHSWWPMFRVAILHQTGNFAGTNKSSLIREIVKCGGILITTYSGLVTYSKQLVEHNWHYVVLDEGHKIRNPEAQMTHCCKLLKTPHRLVLSGSPIQNNLRELWSLFDFIYPGKLGSLTTFMNTVAHPIRRGGYANASQLEIKIAYKCTLLLRDSIQPYLLRRTKEEVQSALSLPAKNEQVLFCKLTEQQRELYLKYIESGVVRDIHRGDAKVFAALIKIRQICNHPYLFAPFACERPEFDVDFFLQSGKMSVVNALLKLWYKQKHKVLLFTQSRQMLDLFERFVQLKELSYLRMDGQTSISSRQGMIREFNTDPKWFIFLLTTRVGGLGVNLIGADRVIIYDPDWNPCTDIQARERCWRIGQNKDVVIYRLLTAGTVEEKIYHRQIYKQYLTNSVLKNANHRRFFKINNLRELFTLNDINQTSLMFEESKVKFNDKKAKSTTSSLSLNSNSKKPKRSKCHKVLPTKTKEKNKEENQSIMIEISEERRKELREQAKQLNKLFTAEFSNTQNDSSQSTNVDNNNDEEKHNEKVNETIKKDGIKTKKVKKGIKFEGKRIKYLVAQEKFNAEGERQNKKQNKKTKEKEDYILQNLLGNSLDVVLQHDTIEQVDIPDHYHLEREAESVAKKALENLRNRNDNLNQNGNAELPTSNRFGTKSSGSASSQSFSSANLIAAIKSRRENVAKQNHYFSSHNESSSHSKSRSESRGHFLENNDLMLHLRDFVHHKAARPTEATTEEILAHFEGRIAPEKSPIFKSMLRSLCDKTDVDGRVIWKLKYEFL